MNKNELANKLKQKENELMILLNKYTQLIENLNEYKKWLYNLNKQNYKEFNPKTNKIYNDFINEYNNFMKNELWLFVNSEEFQYFYDLFLLYKEEYSWFYHKAYLNSFTKIWIKNNINEYDWNLICLSSYKFSNDPSYDYVISSNYFNPENIDISWYYKEKERLKEKDINIINFEILEEFNNLVKNNKYILWLAEAIYEDKIKNIEDIKQEINEDYDEEIAELSWRIRINDINSRKKYILTWIVYDYYTLWTICTWKELKKLIQDLENNYNEYTAFFWQYDWHTITSDNILEIAYTANEINWKKELEIIEKIMSGVAYNDILEMVYWE